MKSPASLAERSDAKPPPQEIVDNPPFRDRWIEATSARAQGTSAGPASAGHLCAQEPWAPAGQRDPGNPQSRPGTASFKRQGIAVNAKFKCRKDGQVAIGRVRTFPCLTPAAVDQEPHAGRHRLLTGSRELTVPVTRSGWARAAGFGPHCSYADLRCERVRKPRSSACTP